MKVLIIRFSSIGDIVLTTPLVRCLKKQKEGIEIHYLSKKAFAPILEGNPYIDKCFFLEDSLEKLLFLLRKEQYDLIIDLHRNLRSLLVKLDLGVESKSFNKLNINKFMTVKLKRNFMPGKHIVDRYLKTVRTLGIRNDEDGLDYFIPEKDRIQVSQLPLTHLHGFVAIAIGAKHETKKLPVERIRLLCEKINVPIILLGGQEDYHNGETIRQGMELKVYNGCGQYNLNQSASLLQLAKKVISHDSGLMHIAAGLKKEVISIWGNTIPEFGMYPYFGKNKPATFSKIIETKGLYCRPCSKLGKKKCPEGHFKCMNQINLDLVSELAVR